MYYIYSSPTNSHFIHVTKDKDLYDERYLLISFDKRSGVSLWATDKKVEICWCDEQAIPHSLT